MSNLVNFRDKRTLSASQNQTNLLKRCKEQFQSLDVFRGQNFESNSWQYLTTTIHFSTKSEERPRSIKDRTIWPEDIVNVSKAYIVSHLWDIRLRKNPLSASRMSDFILPIRFLVDTGIESISDINYDIYWSAYSQIIDYYKRPVERLQDLNLFIKFLINEHALTSHIDTISPNKNKLVKQKSPLVALPEKMPVPELVRAVIQLKWKVEEEYERNPNHRTASDLLCVYTQAFQYGLGLRVGEVLRLPVDCLFEYEGELMCRVWTEKGMMPHARYVPKLWRSIFTDIVDKIHEITAEYRKNALSLESTGVCEEVDNRLATFIAKRRASAEQLYIELDDVLKNLEQEAREAWKFKRDISETEELGLDELSTVLPIFVNDKAPSEKAKKYTSWGMNVQSRSVQGKRGLYYFVSSEDLKDFVEMHVSQRATYITQLELNSIIQGKQLTRDISQDRRFIEQSMQMDGSTAACYTFAPAAFKGKGRAPTAIHRKDALELCKLYAYGNYDAEIWIDVLSFRELFPEIPLLPSKSQKDFRKANPDLEISEKQKITVLAKSETKTGLRYSVNEAYTISHKSIKSFISKRFDSLNYMFEQEIQELDDKEQQEENNQLQPLDNIHKTITIQSRSFKLEQKVSDYLFLRADLATGGAQPNPLVPEILRYYPVHYFFCGNDRYENAFERYGVDCDKHVAESWQSHKGRHWRTTSLFRAGVQESIINKWMGRTELQGRHYDHNTGTERAEEVGKLMMDDQNRFLGEIPHKIRQFMKDEIPTSDITEYLNANMQTVQYTPLGYCVRSLHLNPCDLNMKCLSGNDGNGCKHFIFDLKDDVQRETLIAYRDKVGEELLRLIEAYEERGIAAAKMHIDQQKPIYVNASKTLQQADLLLDTNFAESKNEFKPFLEDGSYPDDCPFQCGDGS